MRRGRTLGLRGSVVLTYAAGALLVSVVLALGSFLVVRHSLLDARQRLATRQAFADAASVRAGLLTAGRQVSDLLGEVSPPAGSTPLVRRDGTWFYAALNQAPSAVPGDLVRRVDGGGAGWAWSTLQGEPVIVVGVPLGGTGASYFEVSSARDVDDSLRVLRAALASFAALTTVVGALLGRAAARRVMSPLDAVAGAAARISVGDLSTRLADTDDRDLATIVGSFNTMAERLDDRIRRDTRFAADLGHELRSPLTTLMTSVDVLERRRGELSPPAQQALDLVSVELQRFRRSLEDLLELGRLDAGVDPTQLADVDLGELVTQVVLASHRSPDLVRVLPGGPGALAVVGDKQRLSRAVVNLLENAELHAGGVAGVRVERVGRFVDVLVDDEGPGVPDADRERIFERFYRSGSRGSTRGTGLGLSLVAETVQAHGGSVWVADRPGGGSRFVMRLPTEPARVPA
ncbi:HAMP domain-containing sensor histidine kinase [Angustibacter aerolatus]